jgi:hypothetical protein
MKGIEMKIWQIEITNNCNYTCVYCPRTDLMTRPIGVMEKATIDRISSVATSDIIRLHHYGESLLYPDLCEYAIRQFASAGIKTGINTNGSAATVKNVRRMFDAGLHEMVISWHPLDMRRDAGEARSDKFLHKLLDQLPQEYIDRIQLIRVVDEAEIDTAKAEMFEYKQRGLRSLIKRKRNLGQVFGLLKQTPPQSCSFLDDPEFCVLWDGSIVSCCEVYDARPEWIIGNIHDLEMPKRNPGCSLCAGCPGYGGNSMETEKVEW